jgi:hypothetical protein
VPERQTFFIKIFSACIVKQKSNDTREKLCPFIDGGSEIMRDYGIIKALAAIPNAA